MPKHDEEDREFRELAKPMFDRVAQYAKGKLLTPVVMAVIDEIVRDETVCARMRDRKFPQMVAVMLPENGRIHIVRRDLEHMGIMQLCRAIIDEWPRCRIEPSEGVPAIVRAILRAFPECKIEHATQMNRVYTEPGSADQLLEVK